MRHMASLSRILILLFFFTEPINIFQNISRSNSEIQIPIRLSYHRGVHYNSVVDPNSPAIGTIFRRQATYTDNYVRPPTRPSIRIWYVVCMYVLSPAIIIEKKSRICKPEYNVGNLPVLKIKIL